ncbi:hypothetical protein J4732_06020 [Serratia marcescens]|uniref:Uncharacterized protein n=1 Tax=Serratia marcescens TaxID=615 RepID=A0A939SNJ5_SERMA|nr:hypothetical protein [Serratia marcescens]
MIYPVQRQRGWISGGISAAGGRQPGVEGVDNTLLLIREMVSARMGLRRCRTGWWKFRTAGSGGDQNHR